MGTVSFVCGGLVGLLGWVGCVWGCGFLVFFLAWPCRGWIPRPAVAKSQLRHLAGVIQGYYVCKRGVPLAFSMFVMCYVCTVCMCWVFFFFLAATCGRVPYQCVPRIVVCASGFGLCANCFCVSCQFVFGW